MVTEWTPPASDHELNKRLADAIGLEVGLWKVLNKGDAWMQQDSLRLWSPATNWNQAVRCAESFVKVLKEEGLWYKLTPRAAMVGKDHDVLYEVPIDHQTLITSFCHVILQALES